MTTNTDTNIRTELVHFGLTTKEAAVYEACLQRGEMTVMDLTKLSRLSRSTAYFVADELVKKGLLRFVQRGAHRLYSAEDPRKLQQLLDQEKVWVARRSRMLESLLPTLQMRYSGASNKPLVSYYVGKEEMQQIFEDALLSGTKELLFVGNINVLREAVSQKYLASWNRRKIKADIKTRGIWEQKEEPEDEFLKASSENMREARHAPTGFTSPTYTLMYGNKVAYLSSVVEAYGVLIESKDLSVTMHSWFKELWERSK